MSGDQNEIPLPGGRVTQGVVRIGDTVHRPPTANSEFVRRLLLHLAARDFDGAPKSLGSDGQGRDVFAFIAGEVPPDLSFYDDATLRQAATLVRRFHDVSAGLVADSNGDVVCHNDLSPCNFVFRAGVPVAIIDFDAAAPGPRAHDLGYAAWLWLDVGSPDISAAEQRRRLDLFLEAYGTGDRAGIVAAMRTRQAALIDEGRRLSDDAMMQWAADCLEWTTRNEAALTA